MSQVTVTTSTLRLMYPYFSNTTTYPDVVLQLQLDASQDYISPYVCDYMSLSARTRATYLMACHLQFITDKINNGESTDLITATTIDKITVTATPPIFKNQFQYWLGLTPYGKELLALLQMKSAGGMYYGGSPERSAFRKLDGKFRW